MSTALLCLALIPVTIGMLASFSALPDQPMARAVSHAIVALRIRTDLIALWALGRVVNRFFDRMLGEPLRRRGGRR